MVTMKGIFCVLLLCGPCLAAAPAQASDKATDPPYRFDRYRMSYDVNADGSYTETFGYVLTVLKESAIEDAKQQDFSYSTSIQDGEVLEAWTQKKDGRRIDVPKGNYQINSASGRQHDSPFFSDYTTVTVVFPDVAVGDKVGYTYRIREKQAIFPGQFSLRANYSRYYPYDDADISITTPVDMKVNYAAYNLKADPVAVAGGRKTYHWTWRNPQADEWKPADNGVDVPADEPTVLFSTFTDYRQISDAYGVRARPKAAVTPRVQALADSLAKGLSTPQEKARALYEWVAKNITYGGNCIGVGAVVPRDIDVILDNRIGDCKDHATLLQALLAAAGIRSSQALINAGALYELPSVPVVSNINHVINYLPDLHLFLDSTAADTPYGSLPFGDAGKPVLLVDDYRPDTRTPVETGVGNRQHMATTVKLGADGSATGTVAVDTKGVYAVTARGWFKDVSAAQRKDMVKYWLQRSGYQGRGALHLEADPVPAGDYGYAADFAVEDFLQNTDAGAFPVRPALTGPVALWSFFDANFVDIPTRSRACTGGGDSEEYTFDLPRGMTVLYLPKDQSISGSGITYNARYRLRGRQLVVTRTLESVVTQNVCTPELLAARQQIGKRIMRELRAQVLYRMGP